MKAIVLEDINQSFTVKEVQKPLLQKGEALVKIKAAALNRRDFWIKKGQYAGLKFPIILGSDGSGIVEAVFDESDNHWLQQEVIILPSCNWGENEDFQGKDFKILGLPDDGTFAEYVKINVENLFPKPTHLSFEEAAALPLAGLTAYRALFIKAKIKKTDTVLITGIGAGTALFVLQFAVASGAKVFITSSSNEKIDKAIALGAIGGVNYLEDNWDKTLLELSTGFDLIIDSAIGPNFAKHFNYVNSGARIVFFGATAGNLPELNPRIIFWKQLQILGTTMGTKSDFEAMLNFVVEHKIVPIIDQLYHFNDANQAIGLMENSSQFGKIVLTP